MELGRAPGRAQATVVAVVDGFVAAYNQWWAMSDAQLVPPCWPRHPALAYDLAAQALTFHWAYLDERATPDRAARFQGELVPFADRLERWLGDQPDQCRAGRHRRDWRQVTATSRTPDRDSTEYADALALPVWGHRYRRGFARIREKATSGATAVVYLALGLSAASVTLGASPSSTQSEQRATSGVLALPGGRAIVVAAGLVIIGIGVAGLVGGIRKSFREERQWRVPCSPMRP